MYRKSIFGAAIVLSLLLSGCASTKPMKVDTQPVTLNIAKPAQPRPLVLNNMEWTVVTKDNLQVFLDEQTKSGGGSYVFVAISINDYKKLSLNMAELKRYIQQQKSIIVYYEKAVSK